MTADTSDESLLRAAIDYKLNSVYTSIPGVVIAVRGNLHTQEVDVLPTINQKMADNTVKERAPVYGVPVIFPSSRTSALTFPINVGDTIGLTFSMRSLEAWKGSNGNPTTPVNRGRFDKSDCWATPGLFPASEAINNPSKHLWPHDTKDTVLVHNLGTGMEVEIRMKPSGDLIINTNQNIFVNCDNATVVANTDVDVTCTNATVTAASGIVLNTSSMEINADTTSIFSPATSFIGDINHIGNYTQTGSYTVNGILVNSHNHSNTTPPMGA